MHSNPRKYLQSILTTDNRIPFTSSNGFNGNKYLVDKYSNISATENTPSSATAANSWKFKQLERRKSQNQLSNYNRSTVECIITAATRHYNSRQQHTDNSWFDMQKQSCLIIPNWQTQTQTMHHDTRPNAKQWPCTCMIVCNSKVSNSNPAWPYVQATTQLQLQLTVVGATVIDQC